MKRQYWFAVSLVFLFAVGLVAAPGPQEQDWTNFVRIGAYGLRGGDAQEIVRELPES